MLSLTKCVCAAVFALAARGNRDHGMSLTGESQLAVLQAGAVDAAAHWPACLGVHCAHCRQSGPQTATGAAKPLELPAMTSQ